MKYTDFTKQYPVSKTLRFELKPIGETAEHLQKILEEDEHRAESYKKVKKIIDRYHQKFISDVLNEMKLPTEDLLVYEEVYLNNRKDENKALESAQEALRKHIVKCFKSNELHKRLFGKELIEEDLLNFVESEEERVIVEEFKGFTTYFTGFNQNRENMYSDEKKHTAIAYRLINENLPKFLDNRAAFKKIVEVAEFKDQLKSVYEAFKDELLVNDVAAMFELNYFNKTITQQQIELYNAIIGGRSVDERTKLKGINELINLYNQQHKGSKLPKLKMLYKQILSDRDSLSFSIEAYSNDNQVLEDIRNFYDGVHNEILPGLKELLESIKEYDLSGVFLRNDPQITDISQHIFGDWRAL